MKDYSKYYWNMPTTCPVCKSTLKVDDSGRLYCPNEKCAKKVEHKILKMSNSWNIKGLGPKIIEDLVSSAKITDLKDFFENIFCHSDLDNICGKNADKIRKNIKNLPALSVQKYLSAFDIEGFSEKKIASAVAAGWNISNIISLSDAKGWTEESSKEFNIKVQENFDDILKCLQYVKVEGVNTSVDNDKKQKNGNLSGLSFCFTGAMEYKRPELEKMVVDNGGEVSSVNKNLSYLVCSDLSSNSSKAVKARNLGIKMITPDEFLKMVKN